MRDAVTESGALAGRLEQLLLQRPLTVQTVSGIRETVSSVCNGVQGYERIGEAMGTVRTLREKLEDQRAVQETLFSDTRVRRNFCGIFGWY